MVLLTQQFAGSRRRITLSATVGCSALLALQILSECALAPFQAGKLRVGSSRAADSDPAIHVAPAGLMLRIFPRQPAGRTRGGISPLAAARGLNLQVESRDPCEGLQLDLASSGASAAGGSYTSSGDQLVSRELVLQYALIVIGQSSTVSKGLMAPFVAVSAAPAVPTPPSLYYQGAATSKRALRV